jgi:hypothetical protein
MKISAQTVSFLKQELERIFLTEDVSVYVEVQDDGEFLLINVNPKTTLSDTQRNFILDKIRNLVTPIIPPRRKAYSWMATISKDLRAKAEEVAYSEMLP